MSSQVTTQIEKSMSAWKLSKIVHREVFLEGSIATSGPQKDRLLERLRDNRNYLKANAIVMKILAALFSLALYVLTIIALSNVYKPSTIDDIFFTLSSTNSMVFAFQFAFVFTYGMMGLVGFFSSSAFRYLHTLPISKEKIQATAYLTYFRLIDWQMISIFIGFPIATVVGAYLLSGNWITILFLSVASFVVSFVNVIFMFSLLLAVCLYIAKKLYKPTGGSKFQTFLQIVVSLLYAIVSLGAGLAISYLVQLVQNGFIIGPNGYLVNSISNIVFYPFGLSNLYSVLCIGLIRGWSILPALSTILSVVSFFVTIGLTYLLFRRSMRIISTLTQEDVYSAKQHTSKEVFVEIDLRTPMQAIYKKDIAYIFRNFSSTLYFIFPILMPLVLLIQVFAIDSIGYDAFFEISMFTFFYSGMTISFGIMCVTAPESETGGLLYLLPSKMRDIYRVKRRIMLISMTLSAIAPIVIMFVYSLKNTFQLSENTLIPAILISLSYLVIYFYDIELALYMYSRFFGKMRNKYTIQMLNVKNKIGKIIFGVILLYIVTYVPLIAGYFLGMLFGESVLYGSLIMLGTAIIFGIIFSYLAYLNFNSH